MGVLFQCDVCWVVYSVCDLVMFSAVEVLVDYGGVYVFHVYIV